MVLALTLLGCLKSAAPLGHGDGGPIAVVGVVDVVGDLPSIDTPDRLDSALLEAMQTRSLVPTLDESAATVGALGKSREPQRRVAVVRAAAPGHPSVLVEATPRFYSELSGQYRWVVGIRATVVTDGQEFVDSFEVPVFLRYHHEREAEAVAAAAPVVSRRVGELVDTWLAAGG